jgi:hypothetical protein
MAWLPRPDMAISPTTTPHGRGRRKVVLMSLDDAVKVKK